MKQPTDFRPEIGDYLMGGASKSLLLVGDRNLDVMKDAIEVVSFLLQMDTPELSQDYMYVGIEEGEKSIGVEAADRIIERGLILPAAADKQVILIDSFDKMTVPAQNKLLKLIEESQTVLIVAVAYEDTVLATIKSRMQIIRYKPLSVAEFETICSEKGVANPLAYYYLTGGMADKIGGTEQAITSLFLTVGSKVEAGGVKALPEVMKLLHMVKEKDKESFFENYREYASKMLSLIVNGIVRKDGMTEEVRHITEIYSGEIQRVSTSGYTKDDFFNFFVSSI